MRPFHTAKEPFLRQNVGHASITPQARVNAGVFGTWKLRYVAGKFGMDDSSHLRITERQVGDWERPQFANSKESGYTTAQSNADVTLELDYFETLHERPFRKTLVITVANGHLTEGDWIEVTYGDTSEGGPGRRAQTFREPESEFHVFVDPFGANKWFPMEEQPFLEVLGDSASSIELRCPSTTTPKSPTWLQIRMVDKWGNTDEAFTGQVSLRADTQNEISNLPNDVNFHEKHRGVMKIEGIMVNEAGTTHFQASCVDPKTSACSNPILCEIDPYPLYWGDLHGQSRESVGTLSADDYFRFARDDAAIDCVGHQANDFQITNEFHNDLTNIVKKYHVPEQYVPFFGWEWSGNTSSGGDRNVHFLSDTGPIHRSSHALLEDLSDANNDACPADELYARLEDRDDVLIVPHVGGRHADLRFHHPKLEPVIEIHSCHGTFEWIGREACELGYRVGYIGGSDVHIGRPGAALPSVKMGEDSLGVRGGLAGIMAQKLTREAIFDALQKRQCYATTGERILIKLTGNGSPIGSDVARDKDLVIEGRIIGTDLLQSVQLMHNWDPINEWHPRTSNQTGHVRIVWEGAEGRGRRRSTDWAGDLSVQGCTLTDVSTVGFDHLGEGLTEKSSNKIKWSSHTEGDQDGIEITLSSTQGKLDFNTYPVSFSIDLDDIGQHGLTYEAGGEGRKVTIEWIDPSVDIFDLSIAHTIPIAQLEPGLYFLKIIQRDCSMAWTSPFYLD